MVSDVMVPVSAEPSRPGTSQQGSSRQGSDATPRQADGWQRSRLGPAVLVGGVCVAICAIASLLVGPRAGYPVLGYLILGSGVGLFVWLLGDRASRRHRIAAATLRVEHGVLVRRGVDIALSHVRAVATRQGPVQRWLGCGDVLVIAPGAGHALHALLVSQSDGDRVWLHCVADHQAVADRLRQSLAGMP